MHGIDEFFERLSWYSPPEVQRAAVEEARAVRNLWLFIQPQVTGNPKAVWENCAKILAERSDEELRPYLYRIFEWLQDMNWPGSFVIRDRMAALGEPLRSERLARAMNEAARQNDDEWLANLQEFEEEIRSAE